MTQGISTGFCPGSLRPRVKRTSGEGIRRRRSADPSLVSEEPPSGGSLSLGPGVEEVKGRHGKEPQVRGQLDLLARLLHIGIA